MTLRTRMAATGIGYAGIDGPWWLPAAEPFTLPAPTAAELRQIAVAVFALFDVVDALYGTPAGAACGLDALLEHRVPAGLLRHTGGGPVLGVRPDFQLVPEGGDYRLVATELEICPSAQGFAHSKTVLAALQLPAMHARMAADSAETLAILDRCIPETLLLDERSAARVLRERAGWVLKYAGFDQGEAAWGGRSLQLGVHSSNAEWAALVGRALSYPWPVVAQRATPSAQLAVAYMDTHGQPQILHGTTRLRAFLLRNSAPGCYGVHLTVAGSANVAEATDAVQAPVLHRP